MPDDSGKLKQGNFMQALESICGEAERLRHAGAHKVVIIGAPGFQPWGPEWHLIPA